MKRPNQDGVGPRLLRRAVVANAGDGHSQVLLVLAAMRLGDEAEALQALVVAPGDLITT